MGTPNGGTAIVEKSHWDALIDGFTNLLRLDPPGPWAVTDVALAGLLELLKVIAEQGEANLPGLAAMEPGSALYADLDARTQGTATHYAIGANYEPSNALSQLFNLGHDLGELTDSSIDAIFDQQPNDVAVPAEGVGDPSVVEPSHPAVPGFPSPPGAATTSPLARSGTSATSRRPRPAGT